MINIKISTVKKHEISPYLYMQFMEPLGTADASIDSAWDFNENDWIPCVIDKVKELAPTMVRFGSTMIDYYHWKEAVGPTRTPMINHCWGGIYHNLVGTHEVIDFCRKVDAEPLIVVNMESDGFKNWAYPKNDGVRLGTPDEAREWVDYCNNPDNALRIKHGVKMPYNVKYWQIGNETSYTIRSVRGFDVDGCLEATNRFVDAMKKADNNISLVAWGDKTFDGENWIKKMSTVDGVEALAFHHHFDSGLANSPLKATAYRNDPDLTWEHLLNAHKSLDAHIMELKADRGNKRLAMTEGHFCLPGRNRNEVLSCWGAGVAYALCHNVIMRHSDVLDIATLADFFGNVWQVNALMIPSPVPYYGNPYLQPVGVVMSLFRKHQGKYYIDCDYLGNIDATASITDNVIYLHVANKDNKYAQRLNVDIGKSAKMYYISADPTTEITPDNTDVFNTKVVDIDLKDFTLPPACVGVIEILL